MDKEEKSSDKEGGDHNLIKELLLDNKKLLTENNRLVRKMHRQMVWGFWLRIFWYALLIGLPFAVYFYVLEPYFEALGSNYEVFKAGLNEVPGLKGLGQLLDTLFGRN